MTNYREEERVAKFNAILKEKNITMLSETYTNARTHHLFKCDECGTEFSKVPQLVRDQAVSCPKCTVEAKAKRHRETVKAKFDTRFYSLGLDANFEIYEYPELMKYPAKFIHKDCGNVIETSIQNLARTVKGIKGVGVGCKYCSRTHTYTEEEIKDYMLKERPNYEYVRSYMSGDHHLMVDVVHKLCNTEKSMQFNFLMRGEGCRNCGMSGGEEMIAYTLDSLGVPYEQEKTFDGLMTSNGHNRRIDFYLPQLNVAIEYDGKQHFEPVASWGGKDYLSHVQHNDQIADTFFSQKPTALYRIPYTVKGSNLGVLITEIVNGTTDSYLV